jgi:hypothetical protein
LATSLAEHVSILDAVNWYAHESKIDSLSRSRLRKQTCFCSQCSNDPSATETTAEAPHRVHVDRMSKRSPLCASLRLKGAEDQEGTTVSSIGQPPTLFAVSGPYLGQRKRQFSHVRRCANKSARGTATPDKTLEAALRLLPSTRHVVVVGGVSAYHRNLESITKASLQKYESKLESTYLTDLDMPTLLERLRHLPSNTIVYHTSIMEDAAGSRFIDATQSAPLVASAANAPVFVVDDVDIGNGTVGGNVLSFAAQGRSGPRSCKDGREGSRRGEATGHPF